MLTTFLVYPATKSHAIELPPDLASPACVACGEDAVDLRSSYSAADWRALVQREVLVAETSETDDTQSVRGTIHVTGIIDHPPVDMTSITTSAALRACGA
ncbi:MAG: hypothetical protein OZ922_02360 [Myxococcales bacterium]|nr:hypothetical protein [Myxococcales bacterium]